MKTSKDVLVLAVTVIIVLILNLICCIAQSSAAKDQETMMKAHDGRSGGASQPSTLTTGSKVIVNGLQTSFDKASTWTVQFSVDPPKKAGSIGAFSAEALISWVLEGNRVTRRVTVANGVSVSGTAQGVQVQLKDTTFDSGQILGADYTVTVSVTPGVRASQAQLVLLQQASPSPGNLIAPTAHVNYPIPDDAGVISVAIVATVQTPPFAVPPPPTVSLYVIMQNDLGFWKTYTIPPVGMNDFIPVPPNATKVVITNLDTANTVFVTLTWAIDG